MGLFDGYGGNTSGILGGLPDWVLNAQAGQNQPLSFADRYSNVPAMQNSGIMADPGLQQVDPQAMQAWRQGVDAQTQGSPPMGQAQMPPAAQPTAGMLSQQGGTQPSMNLPIPQMPSLPSFATQPGSPGFGDRMGAGLAGFGNAHSPMEALANLIGGITTGQRQDPRGYAMQQTQQAQQAAYQAVKSAGGSEGQALAAASSPEVFKALAPDLFGAPKIVKIGSNPITGDQYAMQHGGKLAALPDLGGTGGSGGAPGGSGIMKPGVKYDASLPGEAYLEQFGPEMQAAAKAYLNGDAIPVGNPRLQGIAAAARTVAQTYALKTGTPFSETDYNQKRQMQMDLSKSSPNSIGGILSNGKSAFGHLANLSDKFVDLGNANGGGDYPGSAHIGAIGNYAGNVIAPSATTKGKLTAVNDNALKYGQEATKFYAGSGGGEAERMNALKTAKAETSTGIEQAAFLETEKELMLERFHQKEAQVRDRLGQEYLDKHPIATPELEATVKKIDANIARLRGDKGGVPESKPSDTRQLNGKSYYKQNGKWFEGNASGDTSVPAPALGFAEEDNPIRMAMMDNPRGPRPKPQLADQFGGGGGTATSPPGAPALSRAEINKKAFTATDQLRRSLGVTASTPGGRATDEALKAIEEALKLHSDIKPF